MSDRSLGMLLQNAEEVVVAKDCIPLDNTWNLVQGYNDRNMMLWRFLCLNGTSELVQSGG